MRGTFCRISRNGSQLAGGHVLKFQKEAELSVDNIKFPTETKRKLAQAVTFQSCVRTVPHSTEIFAVFLDPSRKIRDGTVNVATTASLHIPSISL